MNVLSKLSSAHKQRGEASNIALAKAIVKSKNQKAVKDLIGALSSKNKNIQNDSIKVIYEIGAIMPQLISPFYKELADQLTSKNNRMQWGAMTAIQSITGVISETIYKLLPRILEAADKGSVITKDNAVGVIIQLAKNEKYNKKVFPFLKIFLLNAATNQLPMYAEKALAIINDGNKVEFVKALSSRLNEFRKETKKKRVEKVIQNALSE